MAHILPLNLKSLLEIVPRWFRKHAGRIRLLPRRHEQHVTILHTYRFNTQQAPHAEQRYLVRVGGGAPPGTDASNAAAMRSSLIPAFSELMMDFSRSMVAVEFTCPEKDTKMRGGCRILKRIMLRVFFSTPFG